MVDNCMLGWLDDINGKTLGNTNFRTVVYTAQHTQLTLMRLAPGEEIGWESHARIDQFLRLEEGKARVELGRTEKSVDETHEVEADWAFIVPAGVWHNVANIGNEDVKLYSLYSPPAHPDGTVYRTKTEAEAEDEN